MKKVGFLLLGIIVCSIPILCTGLAVPDTDRTLECWSCEPDVPNHPKCPSLDQSQSNGASVDGKMNPITIEDTSKVGFCYQCFIQQTWVKGVLQTERRGCLGGDEFAPTTTPPPATTVPPGDDEDLPKFWSSCTYHYPIDGDFGYVEDQEVQEICRCRGEDFCNAGDIASLGGIGDIRKFPPTTTLKSIRPGDSSSQLQGLGLGYSMLWAIGWGKYYYDNY